MGQMAGKPLHFSTLLQHLFKVQVEPDILECEVKWALGGITMNKANGGDENPVELFQILKDDTVKVLGSNASKSGKLSSGHRTGKGQFSFQCQR